MNARDDMSDADVLTAARDSLYKTRIADPPDVESIMASGTARRRRRLIPSVTGTLAVAAGAALALTALAPASHQAGHDVGRQAGHQSAIQLTAWTVTKLADGNISITIRELRDPAGLQKTLRADGVPASVTFAGQPNKACVAYPGGTPGVPPKIGTPLLNRVFPKPYGSLRPLSHLPRPPRRFMTPIKGQHHLRPPVRRPSPNQAVIEIDPSALPGAAGVQLGASPGGNAVLVPQVVYASSQCTGS